MKTTKLFLAFGLTLMIAASSFATVRTVSNNPAGGSQYSTLVAAYNAAANGDTILIEGTNIVYGWIDCASGAAWGKPLVVIGIGFNPQKQNAKLTLAQGGCDTRLYGNGLKFYGIEFKNSVHCSGSTPSLNNILFEDCKFDGVIGFDFNNFAVANIVFRNCIFDGDNGQNVSIGTNTVGVTFESCIFDGYVSASATNLAITSTFNHCLFLRTDGESLVNIVGPTVTNCIFMNHTSAANSGVTGGTFNNNIARLAATLPPAGNSGSGNLSSTDPNFINYTAGAFYSTAHDYDVQGGSPATDAGSDGTDIGLHGGSSGFSETGEVLIVPIMRSMNINNTTVAPGGTMNVQVESGKPNDD